jgi:predicted RNA binding protein YcfA (HicA-like mRNA interferase family)
MRIDKGIEPKRSYIKRATVVPTKSHESIEKKILRNMSDSTKKTAAELKM